jgi:hypothetical protein
VKPAAPSINDALDRFVAEGGAAGDREGVVELYRSYLDGYGHDLLSGNERDLWQRTYDDDEEAGSFCTLFGPDRILEGLEGFLGWFVIRKVLGPPETIEAAGPVCAELTTWLVEEGYIQREAVDGAEELITAAARDLPLAEELSGLLYESGRGLDHDALNEVVDWEDEIAEIWRIEQGRLWFRSPLGEVGPVLVPPRASEIAGLGWGVSALAFGRSEDGWHILEMGNVYPGNR